MRTTKEIVGQWGLVLLLSSLTAGCQSSKQRYTIDELKWLTPESDSTSLLAVTAKQSAAIALGIVTGGNNPKTVAETLHISSFFHWLRIRFGPGDRRASELYLAWYRYSCALAVKRRIGSLPGFDDPLRLGAHEPSGVPITEIPMSFGDPARDEDRDKVFPSYPKYRELVQKYLAETYPK